jgi:phosphoglycerate dehydrogenase-like enzyme
VILTPHNAGMTRESRGRMGEQAAEETLRMLDGEKPNNFVNPQAWDAARARHTMEYAK